MKYQIEFKRAKMSGNCNAYWHPEKGLKTSPHKDIPILPCDAPIPDDYEYPQVTINKARQRVIAGPNLHVTPAVLGMLYDRKLAKFPDGLYKPADKYQAGESFDLPVVKMRECHGCKSQTFNYRYCPKCNEARDARSGDNWIGFTAEETARLNRNYALLFPDEV